MLRVLHPVAPMLHPKNASQITGYQQLLRVLHPFYAKMYMYTGVYKKYITKCGMPNEDQEGNPKWTASVSTGWEWFRPIPTKK
jgi:hypothetical protein